MLKKLITIVVLCAFSFGVTGCELFNPIGPIIQIGVMWIEGEAHKYYNTDRDTIHRSVKHVLQELNFPITSETNEGDYIYIIADTGDRFKIKIREVRENVTKLSIRVNTFGDHPYAELIYRHVDREPGVKDFATVKQLNTALDNRRRPK